jgi:hypothetical protein
MSEEGTKPKVEIDWLTTLAGVLAAVSSAVVLSTLGAAGTIIGAALGSMVATIGSAVYRQGLAESRERLVRAQTAARQKVGVAQAEVLRADHTIDEEVADAHLARAEERLDAAQLDLEGAMHESASAGWGDRLRALPWRRISMVTAGLFAVVVLALTAFELIAGEPVSSITGGTDGDSGTTVSRIGSADEDPADVPVEEPSVGPTPSDSPAGSPSSEDTDPNEEPTPSASMSPTPILDPSPTEPLTSPTPSASP